MSLSDLLLPTDCVGCGGAGGPGCRCCAAQLAGPARRAVPRPAPAGLPPTWTVAPYGGTARSFLLAYKERGQLGLRAVLATALAASIRAAMAEAAASSPLVVVPVPSARRAVRARGDDVVLSLSRRAAAIVRRAGGELTVVPALRHRRTVRDSAGLTAAERQANLAGAFAVGGSWHRGIAGIGVILADDLITTGASLAESARAVRAGGGVVIGAATVVATPRWDDRAVLRPPPTGLRST
jgi:predicted amidophosphoribosyltransferase